MRAIPGWDLGISIEITCYFEAPVSHIYVLDSGLNKGVWRLPMAMMAAMEMEMMMAVGSGRRRGGRRAGSRRNQWSGASGAGRRARAAREVCRRSWRSKATSLRRRARRSGLPREQEQGQGQGQGQEEEEELGL